MKTMNLVFISRIENPQDLERDFLGFFNLVYKPFDAVKMFLKERTPGLVDACILDARVFSKRTFTQVRRLSRNLFGQDLKILYLDIRGKEPEEIFSEIKESLA